jgi:hypothetical protein
VRASVSRVASTQETEEDNAGSGATTSTTGDESGSNRGGGAGKIKASGQLARWARARKIRAGKLATLQKKNESNPLKLR